MLQRKHDSSSSEDSDEEKTKYLTPTSSAPVTPAGDGVAEKKHKKKKKKKDKDGETVDTPAEETTEKKVIQLADKTGIMVAVLQVLVLLWLLHCWK